MRRFVPLAVAAALTVPATAAALAQAASYNSNVTIGYVRGGPYFSGRVQLGAGSLRQAPQGDRVPPGPRRRPGDRSRHQ